MIGAGLARSHATRSRAVAEMVRVARPGTKIVIVNETEDFASRHGRTPVAQAFYGNRPERIVVLTELLPQDAGEVS